MAVTLLWPFQAPIVTSAVAGRLTPASGNNDRFVTTRFANPDDQVRLPPHTELNLPRSQRSRQPMERSSVFLLSQLNQAQLSREEFSPIDWHDSEGVVTGRDLKHIFVNLGMNLLVPFPVTHRPRSSFTPTLRRSILPHLAGTSAPKMIFPLIDRGRAAGVPLLNPVLLGT